MVSVLRTAAGVFGFIGFYTPYMASGTTTVTLGPGVSLTEDINVGMFTVRGTGRNGEG